MSPLLMSPPLISMVQSLLRFFCDLGQSHVIDLAAASLGYGIQKYDAVGHHIRRQCPRTVGFSFDQGDSAGGAGADKGSYGGSLLPIFGIEFGSDRRRFQYTGAPESHWRQKVSMGAGPLLLLALTKGKFLLLGLTKMGTLLTMLASLGVYWAMYGWAFALGLVVSIYTHEMGHVAAIRRYGFPASAPMFIPGFGAFIQLRGIRLP